MAKALLLADAGETFVLSNAHVPRAVGLSFDTSRLPN